MPAAVLIVGFAELRGVEQALLAAERFADAKRPAHFLRRGNSRAVAAGLHRDESPGAGQGKPYLSLMVKSLRPLARRRLRTLRPLAVAMRARKPILRMRLILDG